jgi:HEAT repeat protein
MWEWLRAVEWSEAAHARGTAEEVPGWLEALAGDDEDARTRAQHALWSTLWDQGAVFDATALAVPFLVELLDEGPREGRAWLLYYLSELATGTPFSAPGGALAAGVRDRVIERLGEYVVYLDDADPEVRMNAAHLLGVCGDALQAHGWLDVVRARDDDERVRATALMAMCRLEEGWPVERGVFESSFHEDASALVRWCAAREWARADAALTPGGVSDVLASALFAPAAIERAWEETPCARGQVVAESAVALARLGADRAAVYVEELGVAMSVAEPIGAIDIAESLVLIAFEGRPPLEPFAQMTRLQRGVLETLAGCDRPWTFNGNMAEMLRFYHLPARRAALRAFIAPGARRAG